MSGRALSPKEVGLANLNYMLDRAALCRRAAKRAADDEQAKQIEADIAALERSRELVELYG